MFFAAQSASAHTAANPGLDKSTIKILIVEDNTWFQKTLKNLLVKRGFANVELANDGQEAVDKFPKLRPQLILMDIVMPNKNGLTATQEIRALERQEEWLPVFISAVSGNQSEDAQLEAKNAGMDEFIAKPINPAKLDEVLARALSYIQREQPTFSSGLKPS